MTALGKTGLMEQRFNPFGDTPRDRNNAVRWLTRQLNRLLPSVLDPDLESQIDEFLTELGELEQFLVDNAESPETEFSDYFLDSFLPIFDFASELSKEKKREGLIFGSWRSDERRDLDHGHSECHERTVVRLKSATAVHHYSCVPQSSVWDCIPVTQHGRTFYLVIAKVSEIDAVCAVPSFSRTLSTTESGLRVLDRSREPKEWHWEDRRNIDLHRRQAEHSGKHSPGVRSRERSCHIRKGGGRYNREGEYLVRLPSRR